ncbi:hypothetical protein GIB67_015839 [Kingdonia uniflora]|uniref:Uncharacterized protein n=1 Tax=Kingdonia uniflora TaxID=39325 RepID=A0A7J7NEA9_9MAGN|nr:hypothetical protein GIB67_015839 [Kingdonia uniflora]
MESSEIAVWNLCVSLDVVIFLALLTSPISSWTDPSDVSALRGLYRSLNNPPQLIGWISLGGDPSEESRNFMLRIICHIHNNGFTGSVIYLANLHLTNLNIQNNHFSGVVPNQFQSILNLWIGGNRFQFGADYPPWDFPEAITGDLNSPPTIESSAIENYSCLDTSKSKNRRLSFGGIAFMVGGIALVGNLCRSLQRTIVRSDLEKIRVISRKLAIAYCSNVEFSRQMLSLLVRKPPTTESSAIENYSSLYTCKSKKGRLSFGRITFMVGGIALVVTCAVAFNALESEVVMRPYSYTCIVGLRYDVETILVVDTIDSTYDPGTKKIIIDLEKIRVISRKLAIAYCSNVEFSRQVLSLLIRKVTFSDVVEVFGDDSRIIPLGASLLTSGNYSNVEVKEKRTSHIKNGNKRSRLDLDAPLKIMSGKSELSSYDKCYYIVDNGDVRISLTNDNSLSSDMVQYVSSMARNMFSSQLSDLSLLATFDDDVFEITKEAIALAWDKRQDAYLETCNVNMRLLVLLLRWWTLEHGTRNLVTPLSATLHRAGARSSNNVIAKVQEKFFGLFGYDAELPVRECQLEGLDARGRELEYARYFYELCFCELVWDPTDREEVVRLIAEVEIKFEDMRIVVVEMRNSYVSEASTSGRATESEIEASGGEEELSVDQFLDFPRRLVELESVCLREDEVLQCNQEFVEEFKRMREANEDREDQHIDEKDAEIKKGRRETEYLKERASKLKNQNDALLVKCKKADMARYRVQALVRSEDYLNRLVAGLRRDLIRITHDQEQIQSDLANSKSELGRFNKKLVDKDNSLKRARDNLTTYELAVEQLTTTFSAKDMKLRSVYRRCNELNERVAHLKEEFGQVNLRTRNAEAGERSKGKKYDGRNFLV